MQNLQRHFFRAFTTEITWKESSSWRRLLVIENLENVLLVTALLRLTSKQCMIKSRNINVINVKQPLMAMQANNIISETTFTKKQYLDDHVLMVHKGINPYLCDFCDKVFTQAHYMKECIKRSSQICNDNRYLQENLKDSIFFFRHHEVQ